MKSFWDTLPRPFFTMAPMADVTDPAFRKLVAKCGKPDVMWTEFVSADGLYHTIETQGRSSMIYHTSHSGGDAGNPLLRDLQFDESERPIVAQIFSSKPEMIAYATKLCAELGFDGVDLNMGCPDKSIEKQKAGAALMKTPELAAELIRAAQEASPLPISVKTRIGYSREMIDEWLPALLAAKPAAITLHLRTRKEMSSVPARWELMPRAVEIRNQCQDDILTRTLLIGNGDVKSLEDAQEKVRASGCDGAMLGRAVFGNPWVFAGRKQEETPLSEKLSALIELAHDFEKLSPPKSFHILKKHIKAFVTGFDGAAEFRAKLMSAENADELEVAIKNQGSTLEQDP